MVMEMEQVDEHSMIMAALSTLSPPQLSDLTHSILSQTLHHHHRLSSLLSSPSAFSLALHHLHSLSLCGKALLIANHLLSSLYHLTRPFHPPTPSSAAPPIINVIKRRDLDAALLLLLLCDVHQQNPEMLTKAPHAEWRGILSRRCLSNSILTHSGIGVHYGGALLPYVEMIMRCWNFVNVMGGCGGGGKEGQEVAAAPAAVVALPAVEVKGGGECGICKEEMRAGRDVCRLPCKHLFHWMCILPWLSKRNTCPYCRFQLPTEDVFGEIQRLWNLLIKKASSGTTSNAAANYRC